MSNGSTGFRTSRAAICLLRGDGRHSERQEGSAHDARSQEVVQWALVSAGWPDRTNREYSGMYSFQFE